MSCEAFDVYIPDRGNYQLHVWPLFLGFLFVYSLVLLDRGPRRFKRVPRSLHHECRRAALQLSRTVRRWISPAPFPLDQLPPELLHEVFLHACTDGGRTGCSLALVSRGVHTHSRAARFNSVTLASGSNWKLRCFLREFDRARRAAAAEGSVTPRVRHLCLLATARYQGRTRFKRNVDDGRWYPHTQYLSPDARTRIKESLRDKHHAAAEALLQTVAGDLETLCLIVQFRHKLEPLHVGHRCFPKLRELWLGGVDDTTLVFRDPAEEAGSDLDLRPQRTPLFPVLSRLHIIGGTTDFRRWSMDAPELVSLRVAMGPRGLRSSEQVSLEAVQANAAWPRTPVLLLGDPAHVLRRFRQDYYTDAFHSREQLRGMASRVVFVPYYAHQDVEEDVRDVVLRRKMEGGVRRLDDEEEMLLRDWLARIKPVQSKWEDGIFVRDFWARFSNDKTLDRVRIAEVTGEHYVEPLIRWNGTV
ncbi:hypothetical protein LXA43DRAFT_64303 [Ganoderma leucocontextum]|nr:hypothetical protein LXA43DRAFT_64303 [Ganoderma leucocontextum]